MATDQRGSVFRLGSGKTACAIVIALMGIFAAFSAFLPLLLDRGGPAPMTIGEDRLAKARDLFDRELYAAAQANYEAYLLENPHNFDARSELVYALTLQGKDQMAAAQIDYLRAGPPMIELSRTEVTWKLVLAYARMASSIEIQVVNDEHGRVQGLTIEDIETISVAVELGFQNGDVLTSINYERVDSQAKAVEIIQKYKNSPVFRVGVLREGKPLYLNYRLR